MTTTRKVTSEKIKVELTPDELQAVAEKVGLDDGKVLLAMLLRPTALAAVGDYINCVTACKNLFPDNESALVECIKGCSKVSTDLIAPNPVAVQ
jgi:hypothetical protein